MTSVLLATTWARDVCAKLFSNTCRLYPTGNNALAEADDVDILRAVCEFVPEYRIFFDTYTHSQQYLIALLETLEIWQGGVIAADKEEVFRFESLCCVGLK